MFGVPINEATVGGALLLSMAFLSVAAAITAVAALWCAARTLRRRHQARRVLNDLAVHLNTAVAMNPSLRTEFDRLEAELSKQQTQKGDQA